VDEVYRSEPVSALSAPDQSAISWRAVAAGAVTAAALTLALLAFGSAMGFSAVSPWSNAGVSAQTFHIATGLYLIVVALLASTVGGYMAGRLRTKWTGLHSDEVKFRDTAHGFLAWAFATVLGAAALGATATYLVGGAVTSPPAGASATQSATATPSDYFVDMLFRPAAGRAAAAAAGATEPPPVRREAQVIFAHSVAGDIPAADRAYLAQLVAARTGLSQADAEKRVTDVIAQAKDAADKARKAAAALSLWLTISMLVGAFAASLAALEGGQLRDGTFKGVIGTRVYQTS
jgi:hypothetical protein